jgi:hypothetical protein
MLANSDVRSTLDCSSVPASTVPLPPLPGVPYFPEAGVVHASHTKVKKTVALAQERALLCEGRHSDRLRRGGGVIVVPSVKYSITSPERLMLTDWSDAPVGGVPSWISAPAMSCTRMPFWVTKVALVVKPEIADPRSVDAAVGRALHDEIAFAGDAEVGGLARRGQGALVEIRVDAAELHARADLGRERVARGAGGGLRGAEGVAETFRETQTAGLEGRRVDVGDVVADDFEVLAECLQTADARGERADECHGRRWV